MAKYKAPKIHTISKGADVPAHSTVKVQTKPKAMIEDHRWWKFDGERLGAGVLDTLKTLHENQRNRITNISSCSRLYGDMPTTATYGLLSNKISAGHPAARGSPLTYNAIQIAADTSVNIIAKTRPKPFALTSGGDFKLKRKAKKLNKLIDGAFYQCDVNGIAPMVYRDCLIWGTGATAVYAEHGEVCIERVPAYELWIDELEAATGNPRQLYRIKLVDRDVLADLFPGHREEIAASGLFQLEGVSSDSVNNLTAVVEGWHLPSSPDAHDGKHAIITSGGPLLIEAYEKTYFPMSFIRWSKPQTGFWGIGAAEQARATQLELNQTSWVIQITHKKGGSSKIWLEEGSQVVEDHLTNDPWAIGWYRGTPPVYITPTFCPAETYQYRQTLIQAVFEIFGISQMEARAEKPADLSSGEALREYHDQAAGRMVIPSQSYDQWHIDTAKLCLDAIKDIVAEKGNYEVKIPGRKFLSTQDWKSINLKDDVFTLKLCPVSQLPDDPAGKLQTGTEWAQAGLITQRMLRRILEFPDLESLESLQNSEDEYLEKILSEIVDEGKYTAPEIYDVENDGGQGAKEMAMELYSCGRTTGLEEERLELLRRFIEQVEFLVKQITAPPPPAGAPEQGAAPGQGAVPLARPEQPPPSPMLPFAAK
jgi:hypothetical protein